MTEIVSTTTLTSSPEWKLEPEVDGVDLKIKASGPDSISIDEVNAEVSSDKVDLASAAEATDEFEKDKVRYLEEFELAFEASFQGEDEWVEVGTSKNQFYVTRAAPAVTPLYHTVVHLGCSNADGETTEADIVDAVWALFSGRHVQRADGSSLSYYADYNTSNTTTATLLADGDGQCGAWAKLFMDSLKSNGITRNDNYVIFRRTSLSEGLIVKNWTFTGSGTSGNTGYPYYGIPDSNFIGGTAYNWKWTEVHDNAGISGQNVSNPASFFNNHQVILVDGTYYDPSYGITYTTDADFQANAIDGFYRIVTQSVKEADVGIDLNGNGNQTDTVNVPVIQFKTKPSTVEVTEQKTTF